MRVMKKKEEKDIELRCEEVQEILTRPPHALVRWGITVFFGVLALLFIGGCFFKYPDIISAEITITTEHPPVWIVARGSGKIQEVYRKDRETIKAGDIIAVLENPAITAHVLELKERITSFILTDSCICQTVFPEKPELGNIQNAYASFIKCLTDYRNFLSIDLYAQKEQADGGGDVQETRVAASARVLGEAFSRGRVARDAAQQRAHVAQVAVEQHGVGGGEQQHETLENGVSRERRNKYHHCKETV